METSLLLLPDCLAVCKLDARANLPTQLRMDNLVAMIRTPEELSVVCPEDSVPEGAVVECGWRALKVVGPLDFSMVGILSGIASTLAHAGVSIFTLSTFDTDYILLKESSLALAEKALVLAGYRILEDGYLSA